MPCGRPLLYHFSRMILFCSSMVYFAAPKAAIRFSSFEFCTSLLTGAHGEDKFNLGNAKGFIAGLGAGTAEAL
jgi:hypothetical protein